MECPHCKQYHIADLRFCPVTGKEITPLPTCPHCHKPVEPGWDHCGHCGQVIIKPDPLEEQFTEPSDFPKPSPIPSTLPPSVPHSVQKPPKKSRKWPLLLILLGILALAIGAMVVIFRTKPASPNSLAVPSDDGSTLIPTEPHYLPSRIVFSTNRDGNFEIYSVSPDGSDLTRLTQDPADDWAPVWSSDGTRILFVSNRDVNTEIYVMNADGSNPINLTRNPGEDAFPDWSTDMQKIVFESMRDGNNEIYVMNADGNEQTRLTYDLALDSLPNWSPDSNKIAFTAMRDGNAEIYLMNADGTDQVNLTQNLSNDNDANWSPDGSMIGFDSDRDGYWEFYTMDPDGSNPTLVTKNNGYYGFADWSPDGRYIVYNMLNNEDNDLGISLSNGSMPTIFQSSTAVEGQPHWSSGFVPIISLSVDQPTPEQATIQYLPTPTFSAPVIPAACGVQNGEWITNWDEDVYLIMTIMDCRFTVMLMMGQVNGEWITISNYLDIPINEKEFDFTYAFDNQNRYQLSGTFTSANTADMRLKFFAPFTFSDTNKITEDLVIETTASVE